MRNTQRSAFWMYFTGTLAAFVALNVLFAAMRSDCGLPGLLGVAGCADDISRFGFPLLVVERGGFAYRAMFDLPALLADILIGLAAAVAVGLVARARAGRAPRGQAR